MSDSSIQQLTIGFYDALSLIKEHNASSPNSGIKNAQMTHSEQILEERSNSILE
jgi:hypothetical protein